MRTTPILIATLQITRLQMVKRSLRQPSQVQLQLSAQHSIALMLYIVVHTVQMKSAHQPLILRPGVIQLDYFERCCLYVHTEGVD